MDRRSILGFILIAVLLTVWMTWNSSKSEKEKAELNKWRADSTAHADSVHRLEAARQKRESDSLNLLAAKDTTHHFNPDSVRLAKKIQAFGVFGASAKGDNTPVTLENEKIKLSIYTKGGRIGQVELKGVKTSDGKPLIL